MSQVGKVQLGGCMCNTECSLGGICVGEVSPAERGDKFPPGMSSISKMAQNRRVLAVLCVVFLGLVVILLYRLETLNSQVSQQSGVSSGFSAFWKVVNPGEK